MTTFRDLFSGHAADYERYRPRYPDALFTWLAGVAPARDVAWDVGTGSGQAAVALAEHFARVIATDPSTAQLAHAQPHPRVSYRTGSAEEPDLEPASVDLATVAQAFHWFDAPRFFTAAARVLRPRGVLALITYRSSRVSPDVDPIERDFYVNVIGADWPAERRLVEEGYASVVFPPPFRDIATPSLELTADWTFEEFIGYVSTWSAVHQHRKRTGVDPLEPFARRVHATWPMGEVRTVRWELKLRVARRD
ncbi:MAG: class I SAM-dependent methyltransferase [Gemmatimonadetes bacterium]|nr:class I SAM-dependent methyltransferase [Gemmatimonadota bacterium]